MLSAAIAIAGDQHQLTRLAERLRLGNPRVFSRIADDRLLLDLRTVLPEDDEAFVGALTAAL